MAIKTFKRGDKIICIDNKAFTSELTVDKEYDCLNYDSCTDCVIIRNDNAQKKSYASPRFKLK